MRRTVKKNSFMRTKGFSLRWTIYPTTHQTAFIGLSMAPGSTRQLGKMVKARHRTISDTTIPVCTIKLAEEVGVLLEVPLGPTPEDQGLTPFKGWGLVPLIINSEEAELKSEDIRKEMT